MTNKPRYSIKKYMLLSMIAVTVGYLISVIILPLLGFGCQGTLVVVVLAFPVMLFSSLYGFYKGLVTHYGLEGNEKLFFGGKF